MKHRLVRRWWRWARRHWDAATARMVAYEPLEVAELTKSDQYTRDDDTLREFVAAFVGSPDFVWERVWGPTDRLIVERVLLDSRTPAWLDKVRVAR